MHRSRSREFPRRVGLQRLPTSLTELEIARHFHVDERLRKVLRTIREPRSRIALVIQAGAVRLIGRLLDDFHHVPDAVLEHVAGQLRLRPSRAQLPRRKSSRWLYESRLLGAIGYQRIDSAAKARLKRFVEGGARDAEGEDALLAAAESFARDDGVVLPGPVRMRRMVREARQEAIDRALASIAGRLSKNTKLKLKSLLFADRKANLSPLAWLSRPPGDPVSDNLKELTERKKRLEAIGLDRDLLPELTPGMKEFLVKKAASYEVHALRKLGTQACVGLLALRVEDLKRRHLDWITFMHGAIFNSVKRRSRNAIIRKTTRISQKLPEMMATIHDVFDLIVEKWKSPQAIGEEITARISLDTIVKIRDEAKDFTTPGGRSAWEYLLRKHPTVKSSTVTLLDNVDLVSTDPKAPLVQAIDYFRKHKKRRRPELPPDAPTDFVPGSWKNRVIDPKGRIQRRGWELCLADQLTESIRTGRRIVEGSGHFEALERDLVKKGEWASHRTDLIAALGIETDPKRHLEALKEGVAAAARGAAAVLDGDHGVRIEDERIVISPLDKEKIPPRDEILTRRIQNRMRMRRIEDVLLEVDRETKFLGCFSHLGSGRVFPRQDEDSRTALLSALLAKGFNHGVATLARSVQGTTRRMIETAARQYIREETLQAAIARLVDFQRTIPITRAWGEGTTSSSDGVRFRVHGESLYAGYNPRYFAGYKRGITVLTHMSDIKTPFYTQVVPVTVREAGYVLDGLLGHGASLRIEQHFVDTAGFTELAMAFCHLLGVRLAPHIKGLGKQRLWLPKGVSTKSFGKVGEVFAGTIDLEGIKKHWDQMLRMVASLREGTVKPSILIRKIASMPKGNPIFRAWQDLGRLVKTLFILDYTRDKRFRRTTRGGLNLGEERGGLSRRLFTGTDGGFRTGDYLAQLYAASCLNLLIAAIAVSNTLEYQRAWMALGGPSRIPLERLRHLSPLSTDRVVYIGKYEFEEIPAAPPGTRGGEGGPGLKRTGS